MSMKAQKEQGTKRTINLEVLRAQGFIVEIENDTESPFLATNVVIVSKHVRRGPVLNDAVANELELTYGVKKANALQKRVVKMLNDVAFLDALRMATKK